MSAAYVEALIVYVMICVVILAIAACGVLLWMTIDDRDHDSRK